MASLYKQGRPSKQDPPKAAGEYRIRDKETNQIVYCGETNNLDRRCREHEYSGKLDRMTQDFEWKVADKRFGVDARRAHECAKLKQHQPTLNQRAGGGGRK